MSTLTMTRAPLRISFFGGGTDYPEYFNTQSGAVLATAIDKFSYITASTFLSKLFDYKIRVSYRQVELVKDLSDIQHAVYRECLKRLELDSDIELHNVADMPSFSGLGSSSTFTVGLLQALHGYKGNVLSGLQLAYEAIDIERNVLHENVGCQDQTLAAVGGFNVVEFNAEDDIVVNRIPISPARIHELESNLFLVFTRITRRASDVVANQLRRVEQNTDTLLRMREMVDEGYHILTSASSLNAFGELLDEAWQLKRSLAGDVSNDHIDQMYAAAKESGAVGGKLLGAGGGGFLLLFAPPDRHAGLRKVFSNEQLVNVKLNAPGAERII